MEFRKLLSFVLISFALAVAAACDGKDKSGPPIVYDGPMLESDSIRILYSDSAIVKVVVEAPKQFQFLDEDMEFPEGIFIQFFETDGSISSTIKADHGYYFKNENRYTGVGNVKFDGVKDNHTLLSDTLHWSRPEGKVYTKSSVTIIEEMDTLRGQGLEAAEDLSTYTILKPEGSRILTESPADSTEAETDETY